MSEPHDSSEDPARAPTRAQASHLLRPGLNSGDRPVDGLITRLGQPDGGNWFHEQFEQVFLGDHGLSAAVLCEGRTTVDQLDSLKDASKRAHQDPEQRLVGMAGYFLSAAAALAGHGVRITSRPMTDLEPVLLDLAEVLAEPWAGLCGRAALVEEPKTET